jgi:hypothetical protein
MLQASIHLLFTAPLRPKNAAALSSVSALRPTLMHIINKNNCQRMLERNARTGMRRWLWAPGAEGAVEL